MIKQGPSISRERTVSNCVFSETQMWLIFLAIKANKNKSERRHTFQLSCQEPVFFPPFFYKLEQFI